MDVADFLPGVISSCISKVATKWKRSRNIHKVTKLITGRKANGRYMAKKLHHLPRNVLESSLRKVSKKALNELSTVENNLQLRSLALQALKNSTPVRLQTVEVIYHKKRTIEEVLQIENKAVLWCRFGDLLDPPLDPILDTYPSVILDIKDVELYKLLSSNPRYIAETRITLYTTCLVTIAPKEEYNIESVVLAFKLSYSQGYLTEAEAMDCFKILNRIFPKASQRYADFHVFGVADITAYQKSFPRLTSFDCGNKDIPWVRN